MKRFILFSSILGLLSAEGLITLERVMHDGTKVKASAGVDTFRREERIRAHLELARQQVEQMGDPRAEELSRQVTQARARAVREKKERLGPEDSIYYDSTFPHLVRCGGDQPARILAVLYTQEKK